jgi:hypothetical protein
MVIVGLSAHAKIEKNEKMEVWKYGNQTQKSRNINRAK